MSNFIKVMQFLRLCDENGQLSLTNLAVIASAVNALITAPTPLTVASLAVSLINYGFKRYVASQQPTTNSSVVAAHDEAIKQLQTTVAALAAPKA